MATSEPLSDLDQWLNIAKHDQNVNAKLVVSVCNAQQRLVHPLPMASTRGSPFATLVVARRGPEGRARKRVLNLLVHHEADSDLRDFFSG